MLFSIDSPWVPSLSLFYRIILYGYETRLLSLGKTCTYIEIKALLSCLGSTYITWVPFISLHLGEPLYKFICLFIHRIAFGW